MNVHVTKMLSCLAVRYGGQRSVLTKPFWVQIATNVFHQDPNGQNVSFKIIAMFTEVSEFHQVFTRFSPGSRKSLRSRRLPELHLNIHQVLEISPGFHQVFPGFSPGFHQVFTRFSPGFHNVFTRFQKTLRSRNCPNFT